MKLLLWIQCSVLVLYSLAHEAFIFVLACIVYISYDGFHMLIMLFISYKLYEWYQEFLRHVKRTILITVAGVIHQIIFYKICALFCTKTELLMHTSCPYDVNYTYKHLPISLMYIGNLLFSVRLEKSVGPLRMRTSTYGDIWLICCIVCFSVVL